VLDAQPGQGAADLGEVVLGNGRAGGRRMEGPAGAIGVQRLGQTVGDQDTPQRGHHAGRGLGGDELRVQDPLRGVIDHRDQRLPLGGPQGEPGMRAAVDVQQLADTGPGLAAAAVTAPRPALGEQARGLQEPLDERVAQRHAMVALGDLVKVRGIEPGIPLPVQPRDARHLVDRGAPRGRLLPPAIPQPVIAQATVAQAPAPQRAGLPAQNLLGLQPGQPAADRLHQHLLPFPRALHDGRGVGHG